MKSVKIIIDNIILILLFLVIYIAYYHIEYITLEFLGESKEVYLTSLINILVPAITSVVATIFGILIAIYIISMQLKKTSYSRLVNVLYRKTDVFYFIIFITTLFFPMYVIATWANIIKSNNLFYIDIIFLLYLSSILSLISIMLKHLSIMNPKIIVERTLRIFTINNIVSYGLTLVEQNTHDDHQVRYQLRTWEHRHNLIDPLGAFHDLLMESINLKERITLHLYLSMFIKRIAFLNGVILKRKFGLLQQHNSVNLTERIVNFGLSLISTNDISKKIKVTVHALHYMVRRAKNLTIEWGIDNHRQIFIINLGDLTQLSHIKPSSFFV